VAQLAQIVPGTFERGLNSKHNQIGAAVAVVIEMLRQRIRMSGIGYHAETGTAQSQFVELAPTDDVVHDDQVRVCSIDPCECFRHGDPTLKVRTKWTVRIVQYPTQSAIF